jgi:hypothetical protein
MDAAARVHRGTWRRGGLAGGGAGAAAGPDAADRRADGIYTVSEISRHPGDAIRHHQDTVVRPFGWDNLFSSGSVQ